MITPRLVAKLRHETDIFYPVCEDRFREIPVHTLREGSI